MGQTSGSDRNYIYKDKSERYRYMNTFYIFAVVILWVLFGVYLLAKLASKSIAVGTAVGNVVLIILFAVVELAFYLRIITARAGRFSLSKKWFYHFFDKLQTF